MKLEVLKQLRDQLESIRNTLHDCLKTKLN